MSRGRKEQEIVQVKNAGKNTTRIVPLTDRQLEKAGIDIEKQVYCKREVKKDKEEIRLILSNQK